MEGMNPAPAGARGPVGAILYFLLFPLIAIYEFFSVWLASRNWRWFFISIPALLVGLMVTVGMAQAYFSQDDTLATQYIERARRAYVSGDHARAEMLYRKAARHSPGDLAVTFAQGLCLQEMQRPDAAMRAMQSIAPLDEAEEDRFLDAHLWLAQAALERKITVEDPLLFAEQHLGAVLRVRSNHVEANRLLTNLAIREDNRLEALKRIPFIVDKYPDTRIIYAQLLDQAGRKEEARAEAKECVAHYQKTMVPRASGDKDRPTAAEWLNFAQAAVLLDRFGSAVFILREGLKYSDDKTPLRQGIARVYVRWSQRMQADDVPIAQQLELLGEALRIAPDSPMVLQRIAVLIGRDEQADRIAEDLLKRSLAEGTAPAIVHFLLGTRAIESDPKAAISHLEQARRLNNRIPVVLNNLAWVLKNQGDLKAAHEYARQAVRLQPSSPNFRETLGQVLIKKAELSNSAELWRDAIAALETANKQLKDRLEIHESLALAYTKVGDDSYAEEHRKLAKEIRERRAQQKKESEDATSPTP